MKSSTAAAVAADVRQVIGSGAVEGGMKALIAFLAAASMLAGTACDAAAASQAQKKRLKAQQAAASAAKSRASHAPKTRKARSDGSDYYEHVLEKVPYGSKRWWSIYDEQHGTPE